MTKDDVCKRLIELGVADTTQSLIDGWSNIVNAMSGLFPEMVSRRVGVLYEDGSLLVVMPVDRQDQIDEALDIIEGANRGQTDKNKMAKLVDVDLPIGSVRERI